MITKGTSHLDLAFEIIYRSSVKFTQWNSKVNFETNNISILWDTVIQMAAGGEFNPDAL